jgi:3-oxoacyl-[acyl-carrier protein] reductase
MESKKIALVTGGSRGIGRAVVLKLASCGMDVVFNYNSGEEAAKAVEKQCEELGVRALALKANVSSSAECQELVERAREWGGRLDVLVNNAGITRDGLIIRMSDEDMDAVLDVNLKGSFYMMREAAKIMLRQKSGKIVNISSVVGIMGNAGQVNYSASKAAVIGMTKSLARELASRKITVNAVAPGMIETDMTGAMPEAAREKVVGQIPFGAMGQPEDIANAVAFLAGDESGYITGQVLAVDGGMAM